MAQAHHDEYVKKQAVDRRIQRLDMAAHEIVTGQGFSFAKGVPNLIKEDYYSDSGYAYLTEQGWTEILMDKNVMESLTHSYIARYLHKPDVHPLSERVFINIGVFKNPSAMSDEEIVLAITNAIARHRLFLKRPPEVYGR